MWLDNEEKLWEVRLSFVIVFNTHTKRQDEINYLRVEYTLAKEEKEMKLYLVVVLLILRNFFK